MSNLKSLFVDEIVLKSLKAYNNLPKNGKPLEQEWTVLSCVLQYDNDSEKLEVVSLGTGSKCIGATKMSPHGDVLNDSHAEVVARRGFLAYLYDMIKRCCEDRSTIFTFENNKFKLNKYIDFYFYSSQLPCGDASIMPKPVDRYDLVGHVLGSKKRKAEDSICDIDNKIQKKDSDHITNDTSQTIISDIHRTGAKCLPGCKQDMKGPGAEYHRTGQVRIKPGRGDQTLSVSCSDKMARWIHLGIHGSLLDMILHEPIYMKMYVFGAGVPYCKESIERALLNRNPERPQVNLECVPEFHQSTIAFPYIRSEFTVKSAPASIIWVQNVGTQVSSHGIKLGVTKKRTAKQFLKASLCISKYFLYKSFLEVLMKKEELRYLIDEESFKDIPYNVMKSKSERLKQRWNIIKNDFFGTWTVKPDIWNFCVKFT